MCTVGGWGGVYFYSVKGSAVVADDVVVIGTSIVWFG